MIKKCQKCGADFETFGSGRYCEEHKVGSHHKGGSFRTGYHKGKKASNESLVKILLYPNREQAYWFKTYEIVEYEKPEDVINDIDNIVKRLVLDLKRDVAKDPNAFNPSKRQKEVDLGVRYVQSDKVIESGYQT